jgi:hypothetical protein
MVSSLSSWLYELARGSACGTRRPVQACDHDETRRAERIRRVAFLRHGMRGAGHGISEVAPEGSDLVGNALQFTWRERHS